MLSDLKLCHPGDFMNNFKLIQNINLVFSLLTLNKSFIFY